MSVVPQLDPALGQLKNELFGMASRSPINAPLFSKEVEAKWAATKAARYPGTPPSPPPVLVTSA